MTLRQRICALTLPLLVMAAIPGHAGPKKLPPLQGDSSVDLKRYQGTWHEVGRIPVHWESDCVTSVIASYQLLADGSMNAQWKCTAKDGSPRHREGNASINPKDHSHWRVTYVWPFWERRWILLFDPDYRWALLGTPDRKNFWILSRKPTLEKATIERLLYLASNRGYQTGQMEFPKPQ